MKQPGGSRVEAWIAQTNKGHGGVYSTSNGSSTNRGLTPRTQSRESARQLDRPQSTPPTLKVNSESSPYPDSRPKTALGMTYNECDRVHQVEHESTRKHNLDAHLPLKKSKPPPWQQKLDGQPSQTVVAPGYILSRSKSKISVTIKQEEFFDPEVQQKKDGLIAQLQQQVDDLSLYLEEERLNHKETRRKGAEDLKDKMAELTTEYEENLQKLEQVHNNDMESLKREHKIELGDQATQFETKMSKMRGELEYLHGAFESYRSQLQQEMDEKWLKKEEDIMLKHQEEMQLRLNEIRSELVTERNTEKTDMTKEHQKEIQQIKKEHKKEMDALLRRFSNAAADVERLKDTKGKLDVALEELADLKLQHEDACRQVGSLTRDLTDTKVQLMSYEHHFQDKVQEVDDKYKHQIHELMTQNTELRRLYVKKCGELFDEKTVTDQTRMDQLASAKDTMKLLINTRNRAVVNMAATDADLAERLRPPKERPVSAPLTKDEIEQRLLSAGETDDFVREKEALATPVIPKPHILNVIEHERAEQSEVLSLPSDPQSSRSCPSAGSSRSSLSSYTPSLSDEDQC